MQHCLTLSSVSGSLLGCDGLRGDEKDLMIPLMYSCREIENSYFQKKKLKKFSSSVSLIFKTFNLTKIWSVETSGTQVHCDAKKNPDICHIFYEIKCRTKLTTKNYLIKMFSNIISVHRSLVCIIQNKCQNVLYTQTFRSSFCKIILHGTLTHLEYQLIDFGET